MIPAMCVPWPYSSVTGEPPLLKLTFATTRCASAECGAMPESMTAMPMPCPFTPGMPSNEGGRPLVTTHSML